MLESGGQWGKLSAGGRVRWLTLWGSVCQGGGARGPRPGSPSRQCQASHQLSLLVLAPWTLNLSPSLLFCYCVFCVFLQNRPGPGSGESHSQPSDRRVCWGQHSYFLLFSYLIIYSLTLSFSLLFFSSVFHFCFLENNIKLSNNLKTLWDPMLAIRFNMRPQ